MTPVLDKSGQEICPGDFIVYGHNIDRSAALRFGKVIAVKPREGRWAREENAVTVTVIGVEDDSWIHPEPRLCRRKGSLLYPNRILCVSKELVPEPQRTLLENYK